LVDPTAENPWDYLEFQPDTGHIAARFDKATDRYLEKGEETVQVLLLSEREDLAEGYQRTWKRLGRCVSSFLQGTTSEEDFIHDIFDADDHGLLGWCLCPSGEQESPFRELAAVHPETCRKLRARLPG
ncbi:MAG: hypothetical protein JNL62_19995, partial [Bryobacterales bacterium]|nr:hypothetical protein [Bryobacterales bacterium]